MANPAFFSDSNPGRTVADLPNIGTVIQSGHPILTLRYRARGDVLESLVGFADEAYSILHLDS